MKRKLMIMIVASTVIIALMAVAYGSLSWNERIERSGTDATLSLMNEGITIRTVDTSLFAVTKDSQDKDSDEVSGQTNDTSTKDSSQGTVYAEAQPTSTSTVKQTNETKQANQIKRTKPPSPTNAETPTTANGETDSAPDSSKPVTEEPAVAPQKSLLEIKQSYNEQFLVLGGEIGASLDSILDAAVAEINTKRTNNQKISISDFQNNYITKIIELESYSDREFNLLYRQLEAELVESGLSSNEAQPFRAQYQAEKQLREKNAVQRLSSLA